MWYLPVEVEEEVAGRLQVALSHAGVAWSASDSVGRSAAVRRALLACHPDRNAGGIRKSSAGETQMKGELGGGMGLPAYVLLLLPLLQLPVGTSSVWLNRARIYSASSRGGRDRPR